VVVQDASNAAFSMYFTQLQRSLGLPSQETLNRDEAPPPLYDPDASFMLLVDFAMGLPQKMVSGADVKKARLVYGLYEVSTPHLSLIHVF